MIPRELMTTERGSMDGSWERKEGSELSLRFK